MPAIREVQVDGVDELLDGPAAQVENNAVTAKLLLRSNNMLGEGVVYDETTGSVLWTDILGLTLHKLETNQGKGVRARASTYEMPRKVGSFGLLQPTQQNAGSEASSAEYLPLLMAWEDGFQLYDLESEKALSERSIGEDVNPAKGPTRLNDGRTDPSGRRFVCGGYYGEQKGTKMKVYKVEQREGKLYHEPIVSDLQVANSICWSVDGKTMYLADSPTNQIHAYDYDTEQGAVDNKKLVHTKSDPETGVPDGSCIDTEGYIWNAVWCSGARPGMVQRIHPTTGEVVFTVHIPDATSQVTCCCFGGKDFDVLFMTTAAEGRDASVEPNAGGLYAVKLPFQGKPEARLNFTV